jgi:hypothetical protein
MQKCRKRAEMPGAEKEKQEEIEKRGEEHWQQEEKRQEETKNREMEMRQSEQAQAYSRRKDKGKQREILLDDNRPQDELNGGGHGSTAMASTSKHARDEELEGDAARPSKCKRTAIISESIPANNTRSSTCAHKPITRSKK